MLEKITAIINNHTGADAAITAETTFADLGIDSLDTVEILMALEDEFNVTVEMNENIKSVGDLMKAIEAAQ